MQHRFQRQIQLKGFGPQGQEQLKKASVLVVGAGGLGVPVLQYLNAMGVGTLGIVDGDTVDETNLHRQVLYHEADVGQKKVWVAQKKLQKQNSSTKINVYPEFLSVTNALEIISVYDVVVDASDNFATRYLVNDACVILKKPFVYGALHEFEGQVCVFNHEGGPTYRCLFPLMPSPNEIPNCNEQGVLGIVPGIVGNFQALEVIKLLVNSLEINSGILFIYNGLDNSFSKIQLHINPQNQCITELAESYTGLPCQYAQISTNNFAELRKKNPSLQLVDVRSQEEFAQFHLPNSLHIPIDEISSRYVELNLEETIYLICQTGKRSALAQETLQKIIPSSTLIQVTGGIEKYHELCL